MKDLFNKFVNKIFYPTCGIFTVILVLFTLLFSSFTEMNTPAITIEKIFVILCFSFLLSLANLILSTKLNSVVKCILHFLASALDFVLTFILWAGYSDEFTQVFFFCLAFVIIYFAVALAVWLLKVIAKKAADNSEEYKGIR